MRTRNFEEMNKELEIVWLEDPRRYEYVRESNDMGCNAKVVKRDFKSFGWRLIGYEKLPQRSEITFREQGKMCWLKDYDRGMPNDTKVYAKYAYEGRAPSEAVKFV